MINRPKGTKDVIPSEVYKWQYVENTIKRALGLRGFKEIRTPVFEHTELFVRGVGEGSDIVNKEMYTFLDKGERSITLKPEGTASIVRALIENGLDNEAMPQKLYMLTPCFRYEKPQSGRLREHHQFSIEAFGSVSPVMDYEVISAVCSIFDSLNFHNYTLNINSIGCKECRKNYAEALRRYYEKHIDNLCEDCHVRLEKNPLRLLDCKDERCKPYKADAPKPINYLCEDCKKHFKALIDLLDATNISYKINDTLVRGIDYYTRTVFEFMVNENGALSTICGGGRYDGLVQELGGKDLSSVGVGIGIERLLLLLDKNGIELPNEDTLDLYLAPASADERVYVTKLAYEFRKNGLAVDYDTMDRSIKAQMKYANKIGAKYVIVIGGEEVLSGKAVLKSMTSDKQQTIDLNSNSLISDIIKEIKGE